MKKTLTLLVIALTVFTLFSCTPNTQISYRNDTSCAILGENVESNLTLASGLEFLDKGELALQSEPAVCDVLSLVDDYIFRFTGGNSFDEYAVFHVADENDVETVKKAFEEYMKVKREDALYRTYFPGEEYKLDDAQVTVYGNYVIYGALSEEGRNTLFSSTKQLLLDV